MIQRIQSVYLFVASLALGLMFVFPISRFYGDLHTLELSLLELKNLVPTSADIVNPYFTYPLAISVIIISAVAFISIFFYKKRRRQILFIQIDIFLNILLIFGVFFVYTRLIQNQVSVDEVYDIASYLPLISLVALILAYRGVKKDEMLVRSADRLR